MKRLIHTLALVLLMGPVLSGGGFDVFRGMPPNLLPHPELRLEHFGTQFNLSPTERDLLLALDSYENAMGRYGEFSREAHAAASDLEAAIEMYLETHRD